jgi:tetratricopeptide (TPR) repeat protein
MVLVKEAEEIYDEIGETHCLATALLQEAIISQYAGEPDRALRRIERATSLLDPDEDPDLLLVARFNRVRAYASVDPSERALSSFRAAQKDDWHGRPAMKLRAFWQEGQILSELGYLEAAETALCSARRGFIDRDLAPEVVAASRDLAGLYRKMGKREALEQTVLDTQALYFGIPAEVEVRNGLRELERMAML